MKNNLQYKIYFKITKRWFWRLFFKRFGFYRDSDLINKQYESAWGESLVNLDGKMAKLTTRNFDGRSVQLRAIDIIKSKIDLLSKTINKLQISKGRINSILEFGSGDGLIIMSLAVKHPEIKIWRGLELTPAGIAASKSFLKNPPLKHLKFVTGVEENIILQNLKNADIDFQIGSMIRAPFPDKSFDTVYSSMAIEQIPRDYPKVFAEARRIAKTSAFFLEEFLEVQNIFNRMHLDNVDYFHASFKELEKAGFKIIDFMPYNLNSLYFKLGLTVCSA